MFTNKKSLLALSIASVFALSGCFSDDDGNDYAPPGPGPDPEVVVPPEAPVALTFVVSGSVVDSEANVIDGATVKFLEGGAPSTNIVDVNGEDAQTIDTAEEGGFIVTLKNGSATTNVTAIVSAAGYSTKAFNLDLSNEDDFDVLTAQFVLTGTDAEGLAADTETSTAISGSTTTAAISADATPTGGTSLATATLPSGITLQNAAGEAITGDSVTLSVLGTDPASPTKGAVIPEGLNANNTSTNVAVPVALADINLLVGETPVKKFAGDTLSVTLAAPTDLAAGETLAVSSFNEDTGEWAQDSFAVTQGTGTVSFDTDHLTWFAVTRNAAVCASDIATNVTGTVPAGGLLYTAISSDGSLSGILPPGSTTRTFIKANQATRFGIYAGATARVKVSDREGGVWYDSQTEVNICGTTDVTVTAPFTLVNKELTLSGVCANDTDVAVDVSNSTVKYRRAGKGIKAALKDADGNFQLTNLREGENYEVTVNFRGLPLNGDNTFTIEDANADALTQEFQFTCPTSTGGTGGTGGN
ncbi:hypothetical protein [Pseudoalteromonas sp. ASV78]|uniref:hypothetical protein n=1 Tax=Pseudoalteromonas sp. ASV78 TaxID=3397851 RepID=UPI0039FBC383